jgi:hypothetical protein
VDPANVRAEAEALPNGNQIKSLVKLAERLAIHHHVLQHNLQEAQEAEIQLQEAEIQLQEAEIQLQEVEIQLQEVDQEAEIQPWVEILLGARHEWIAHAVLPAEGRCQVAVAVVAVAVVAVAVVAVAVDVRT